MGDIQRMALSDQIQRNGTISAGIMNSLDEILIPPGSSCIVCCIPVALTYAVASPDLNGDVFEVISYGGNWLLQPYPDLCYGFHRCEFKRLACGELPVHAVEAELWAEHGVFNA